MEVLAKFKLMTKCLEICLQNFEAKSPFHNLKRRIIFPSNFLESFSTIIEGAALTILILENLCLAQRYLFLTLTFVNFIMKINRHSFTVFIYNLNCISKWQRFFK